MLLLIAVIAGDTDVFDVDAAVVVDSAVDVVFVDAAVLL